MLEVLDPLSFVIDKLLAFSFIPLGTKCWIMDLFKKNFDFYFPSRFSASLVHHTDITLSCWSPPDDGDDKNPVI